MTKPPSFPFSSATRMEKDTMGSIPVPKEALWGAQTQRSLINFNIGDELMPKEIILALGLIKGAIARYHGENGALPVAIANAIEKAAKEVSQGDLMPHFPLKVWQTGSGTQTNMNVNEVIARRANSLLPSSKKREHIHPNDHVNKSQSSNDTFPTAMYIASFKLGQEVLVPSISEVLETLAEKVKAWKSIVKIGRTHTQDATPLTLGQEFSAFHAQLKHAQTALTTALESLLDLPQGGTAVGTGQNTFVGFDKAIVEDIARTTSTPFRVAHNKFEAIAAHDAMVQVSGSLNTLAVALMKIANDIRFLASGPRAGLAEIFLPANEPGSSIMPGKVNPTQCEALTMVCAQVMGHHLTISIAGASGHFQLNAFKPVIAFCLIKSLHLLASALNSFHHHCLKGITPNKKAIRTHLHNSLMLVTALVPLIGYDKAASIALTAHKNGTSLRQEALKAGIEEKVFDTLVDPEKMLSPREKL